jgi:peptide/nickel transport system substrate-binding protein
VPRLLTRLLLCIACVMSSALAACGTSHAPCSPGPLPTLRIAFYNPTAPQANSVLNTMYIRFTDWSFLRLDVDGRPLPLLARHWQTTDRRTWTLTLPPNLRSHDGQPLTAERSREATLPRTRRSGAVLQVWRELEAIEAPTPTTMVFRFARPNSAVPEALSSMSAGGETETPLSAGPFRLVTLTPARIDLAAFREFWDGPPTLAGIRIDLYPTNRAAWAAFLRHDADLLYDVPPDALASLAKDPDVRIDRRRPRQVYTLLFQHQHPLLRDVRVRQALNLAIDRDALVRRLFPDFAQLPEYTRLATAPFSPDYWAVKGAGSPWPYDPAAARTLLAQATAGRAGPIELTCLVPGPDELISNVAAVVETQLQRVHVRLRLETVPIDTFRARVGSGNFELAITPLTTGATTLYPHAFWHSQTPIVRSGYHAADRELDAVYHAETPEAEQAAARDVIEIMRRDPPAAFLMPSPNVGAIHSKWIVPDERADFRPFLYRWTLEGFTPCGAS